MPEMTAIKTFSYAGRRVSKGDTFLARKKDVKILSLLKKAEKSEVINSPVIIPESPKLTEKHPKPAKISKDKKAKSEKPAGGNGQKKQKRTYKRRDMRAEADE